MEIYFCERCAGRVADVELDRGEGRRIGDRVWCKNCVEYSPGYGQESQAAPTRQRPKTGFRLTAVGQRPQPPGRKIAVGLGAAVGVVLALVAALVSFSGRDRRTSRSSGPHPGRDTLPPPSRPAPPGTGRSRRRAVRSSAVRPTGGRGSAGAVGGGVNDRAPVQRREELLREAQEALKEAVERAEGLVAKGDFDGADAALKGLLPGHASCVREELDAETGKVRAFAESKVNALLKDAEGPRAEGKMAEARESLEALDGLRFASVLPLASARVEEIRKKIAEAEAEAREAAEQRDALLLEKWLCEFEARLLEREYAQARQRAEERAAQSESEAVAEALKSAARVARALEQRARHLRRALEQSTGQTISVQTTRGERRGELSDVDDEGLTLVTKISRGGHVGSGKDRVSWYELTAQQEKQLLEGIEPEGADEWMAEALAALSLEDIDGAETALARTGEHPLAKRVRRQLDVLRADDIGASPAEAWERLAAEAGADDLTAPRAQRLLERLALFQAEFGETEFADSHALDVARLQARLVARADAGVATTDARPTQGPIVLYTFDEGHGTVVRDSSGMEPRIDLRLEDPAAVRWIVRERDGRQGIEIVSPTKIIDSGDVAKLVERIRATNQMSVEVWFEPRDLTQAGPARIVSFSVDYYHRNFTLGQQGPEIVLRVRTTGTNEDGAPDFKTGGSVLAGGPVHVVGTLSGGKRRLYFNGNAYRDAKDTPGDLSNWSEQQRLLLGDELTGRRAWLGKIFRVAVYDRALGEDEVRRKSEACR